MRPTSWSVSIQRADGRRPSADSQVPRWIYATTVLTVPRFGRPAEEPVWQTPGGGFAGGQPLMLHLPMQSLY